MKMRRRKSMAMYTKTCEFCGEEYLALSTHGVWKRQRYCSARCRTQAWIKENPERDRELKRQSRLRKPVICRSCSRPIPNEFRRGGRTYCSLWCLQTARRCRDRVRRTKVFLEFARYKEKLSCQCCGYNQFGGSLDFHHLKGKDFRIDAGRWWTNSKSVQEELKKCILLCKNCHYEEHRRLREA